VSGESANPRAQTPAAAKDRPAGALYVHLQSDGGVDHKTFVVPPRTATVLRALWSPWGVALALAVAGSWVYFGVESARIPLLNRRIAALQAEALRIDTLQAKLQALQLQYDQVQAMLGAAVPDSGKTRSSGSNHK